MRRHTPGPWQTVNVGTDDEPMMSVRAARIAGQPPRHEVALCATGDSPQAMEDANAHLITAAPEMLEALQVCAAELAEIANFAPQTSDPHFALNVARAAIAKATGEGE